MELHRVNTTTDHGCFGCGERNDIGLKLAFYRTGNGVFATFTPDAVYEGYAGMLHGGIAATLLDEAMSWAVIDTGKLAVTARMSLEFRRPIPPGQQLTVRARVMRDRRRIVEAEGEIVDGSGQVLVTATSSFVRVTEEQQREWESTYFRAEDRRRD